MVRKAGAYMNDRNFIRERISDLRMQKGVSEYQMSLDLGHSKSYIQSISSGKSLPSMPEFLSICDYLGVTPKDFFDVNNENPKLFSDIQKEMLQMDSKDMELVLKIAKRLNLE